MATSCRADIDGDTFLLAMGVRANGCRSWIDDETCWLAKGVYHAVSVYVLRLNTF